MEKLNALGQEVLAYKKELLSPYPDLVIKSLLLSVDEMTKTGLIDIDINYQLKDKDSSIEGVRELLLNKESCLKTTEELFNEYEDIRKSFDKKIGIEHKEDKYTESFVENEQIALFQDFIITEEFIREYFYIETEKDFETLMGRKNFFNKFAILRLQKILKDFIKETPCDLTLTHSPVFYHESKKLYGIQLVYTYNIEDLEDASIVEILAQKTNEMMQKAMEYYERKMTA